MLNKKGAAPIVTGVLILVLSVFVMIIILGFAMPFFNNLDDSLRYNSNKRNILTINEQILNIKENSTHTETNLTMFPADDIIFDAETDSIIIKQKIKNEQYNIKEAQEQIYNNLNIRKINNEIVFNLNLSGIVDLNQSIILNNSRQLLKITIGDNSNGVPIINISTKTGKISRLIITPQSGIFSNNKIIIATAIPLDSNIYYTTDGNEPDQNSTLYTGPLTITETSIIKFRAFKEGYEPSKIVIGNYTKINGLLFFNNYTESNPILDLSGNNNEVINNNVTFGTTGAYFPGDPNKYLFIKNDWNGSNTSLNLGNNNFTIEAFISSGYRGHILSKTGYIGGLDLSINNDGLVDFSFSGYDQFWSPYDIAEDANYIYITDTGSNRVQKRRKDNWELVLISGGPRATTAVDGYSTPYGIAVDDEFVYISDYANNRIVKRYKSDFTFHSMLSGGAADANTAIRGPYGITVDENYIYVTEAYYHRIKKLDKNTFAVMAILGGPSAGTGDTQFNIPRGIAIDDDYMYVVDAGSHRIKKYNKNTFDFESKVGGTSAGTGNDSFYTPIGITVDENFIYVAENANNRIMIRNKTDLTYYNKIVSSGQQLDDDYIFAATGVITDENYIYFTENTYPRIKKINKSDYSTASVYSNVIANNESLVTPYDITHDENYLYYTDAGLHRVVKRKIADMSVVGVIGGPFYGSTNTTFYIPYGIVIKDNRLYVADYGNNQIKIYDKDTLSWVYTCTPGVSFFRFPTGIAYDENYFYVATIYSTTMDSLHKLEITDSSCTVIQTIGGTNGSDENQFTNPYGVVVDDTYVYVADTGNHRIKKHLKSDLSFVSQLGITTYANAFINTFNTPYNILIDNNYLYVSNSAYRSIRKYTTDFNYISNIGFNTGFANDEFLSPRGLTIINGYMYIADNVLGRITKRSMTEFDVNINITGAGTDFNFFYRPIAIDSDENYYYVANSVIHRVEKRLKSNNTLVAYFGGPYNGVNTYFLYSPSDVVLDGNYVYVADRTNHRIVRLNKSDLTFSAQYGVTGTASTATTNFSSPTKIAIDATRIYVTDYGNNRIKILNKSDLSYVSDFGTLGTGIGPGINQFSGPYGIAVDDNYLYISEYTNNRIQKRNKTDLSYVAHLGGTTAGATDTTFNRPYDVSLDINYIYVADTYNHRIKKHLKSDLSFVSKVGSYGFGDDLFYYPAGIRYKDANTLLIAGNNNDRIQIRNPSTLSFVSAIDLSTYSNDGVYNPYGVAVDENYLYIVDTGNFRIVKKNKTNLTTVASIGGPIAGTGNDQFNTPYGIAVDNEFIYVADYSNNRIVKRNKSDLSWVYTYSPGTAIIYSPVGLAVDGNNLYVTTIYSRITPEPAIYRDWLTKIDISSTPWTVIQRIGEVAGSGINEFNDPRGVAVDGNYVYIADTTNHRIQKRNKSDLSLVTMYGIGVSGTNATNAFSSPYGINVHNGLVYITDYSNHRIKVFDTNFNFLYKFGRHGWGQDTLYYPTDLAVDDNYIYIADYSNHRVVKRSLSELENIKNIPKTNLFGVTAYNGNTLSSVRRITTESQIVIKRTGDEFCIYINGEKDNCADYTNKPTYLTFPEINDRYGSSAITETYYLPENQNYYPYAIGNYGLTTPGNGHIKYLRIFDSNLSDVQILGLYENE